jgi:WD40 repeat protein
LSVNQDVVLTVGQERKITFWDLRKPQPLQQIVLGSAEAKCVAISPDGRLFATGTRNITLC